MPYACTGIQFWTADLPVGVGVGTDSSSASGAATQLGRLGSSVAFIARTASVSRKGRCQYQASQLKFFTAFHSGNAKVPYYNLFCIG